MKRQKTLLVQVDADTLDVASLEMKRRGLKRAEVIEWALCEFINNADRARVEILKEVHVENEGAEA